MWHDFVRGEKEAVLNSTNKKTERLLEKAIASIVNNV
jgi:hypothetical protein